MMLALPVLAVSATELFLVQAELVLGVVTDDYINPMGTAPLGYTIVSHHQRNVFLSPR